MEDGTNNQSLDADFNDPAAPPAPLCDCGAPRSPGLGCCWRCFDRIAAKSDSEWRDAIDEAERKGRR